MFFLPSVTKALGPWLLGCPKVEQSRHEMERGKVEGIGP